MPKDLLNRNARFYGAVLVGLLAMTFGSLEYVNVAGSPSQTVRSSHDDPDGLTSQEWTVIKTLSPLPPLPVDPRTSTRDSAAAAALGQKLFFEPRLSGPIQTGTPRRRPARRDRREAQDRLPQLSHAGVEVAVRHPLEQRRPHPERDRARLAVDDAQRQQHRQHRLLRPPGRERTGARTTASRTPSGSTRRASPRARPSRTAAACSSRT